ncbi:PREDICTED: tRNA-dihydrouridine(16/17) synthase [NAD(P)(+)]-like isoform X1 [Crocodylus porosus]|uniref:tRNA-dihydrouridine(16/17) synthase [NAD(P)(+)]-like isoform X1 n=1 Tax=Crocodylus porosus TaxID=8502 RepID=UPI00093FA7EB|nr:PREDICTED: tRNA-dihydrouridine(16/17) synthase [NAD(P)(+)]-like isoform X1 [Crocodylus porosus]
MPKLHGEEFWRTTLRSARYVVAPMVDQSELAWRLLSRRHGAHLCYTPMLHAQVFVRDANYRKENLYCDVCPEDRPLIVQFCANDPEVFVQAAVLAQDYCDAIDLNLGCPQMIAKRGHYGAFLQEEWDLLQRMIWLANEKLSVPITCKIRVFPEIDKTVKYAQMLEKAGCQLLTVHGRTKEQKGPLAGVASWEHIKAVRKAVSIPVFANGNIQSLRDVEECLQKTGVQGVMSAEGNLHNPALFEGQNPLVWEMAEEYLEIVQQYPCPLSYVRAHLFKLWHHPLQVYQQLRDELAKAKTLEGIADVSRELKLRCQEEITNQKEGEKPSGGLPFFHWICQPYIRPGPFRPKEICKENGSSGTEKSVRGKRSLEDEEDGHSDLSKNKQKKKLRNPNKSFDPSLKPKYAKCDQCGNPKGNKCVFNLCRGCCKKRAFKETADCPGHGLLFRTKYEKSLVWKSGQTQTQRLEMTNADVGESAAFTEVVDRAV